MSESYQKQGESLETRFTTEFNYPEVEVNASTNKEESVNTILEMAEYKKTGTCKILIVTMKKYYGTEPNITRALDGVNFSVEDGKFVAVVGTSGSGKSTLLNMMGGLDTPTSGTVIVRGEELAKKNDEQLTIFRRRNIGFIFQNYNLVPILNVGYQGE